MFSIHKHVYTDELIDSGHGRIETIICQAIENLTFMHDIGPWIKLKYVVRALKNILKKQEKQLNTCGIISLPYQQMLKR